MHAFKRYALVTLFIVVSILLVSGLVYVAGRFGIDPGVSQFSAAQILVTARPPLPGTPVARFAQLNPAIVPYLDRGQPSYGVIPLDALGEDIQPVGAYLPRTGNTRFDLATATTIPPLTRPATLSVTITPLDAPSPSPAPIINSPIPPTLIPPIAIPPTDIPAPPVSIVIVPTAIPPPIVVEAPVAQDQVVVQPPALPPPTEADAVIENVIPPTAIPPPPTAVPAAPIDCAPAGLPVSGVLTQRFHQFHIGIDIGVPIGTPIHATHSGTVFLAGWSDIGYGNVVAIQNGAFITYYGHQTSVNVTVGQFVHQGDLIGWSGSTGNSNGPHVHYETRINDVPVDPLTFESRGYPTC